MMQQNYLYEHVLFIFNDLGDTSDSLFSVSSAGVVSAVGVLDRETVDFYTINVAVSSLMITLHLKCLNSELK